MAGLADTVLHTDGHDPPKHALEGVCQGLSELSGCAWYGMHTAAKQPLRYAAQEGLLGAGKGCVYGALTLTESLCDGVLDLASYVVEGVRNTPEALTDYFLGEDHFHRRHLVDRQEGRMLETFLYRQPRHLADGIGLGTLAVGHGVVEGTTSLVLKNVEAVDQIYYVAEVPTLIGKGMVQGATGFTTKAAASGLDFAEAVVDGARNTPDYVRCKASRIELGTMKLAHSGYDVMVEAARKAGELEQQLKEKTAIAWQNRPRVELTPLGAPAAPPQQRFEQAKCQAEQPPVPQPASSSSPPRPWQPPARMPQGYGLDLPREAPVQQPAAPPMAAAYWSYHMPPGSVLCSTSVAETPRSVATLRQAPVEPTREAQEEEAEEDDGVAEQEGAGPSRNRRVSFESRMSDSNVTVTSKDRESQASQDAPPAARKQVEPAAASTIFPRPRAGAVATRPAAGIAVQPAEGYVASVGHPVVGYSATGYDQGRWRQLDEMDPA